jgi:phosphatidate cytidylyltransferase
MPHAWGLLGVLAFCSLLYMEMLLSKAKLPFTQVAMCFAAGIVVPYMMCAVVRIHAADQGRGLILIPFILAFLSDSGAYFAGCFFGKHKLAPVISPKKTVEGVVGGVLAGMLSMVIYCVILQLGFDFEVNYLYALIYGLLGSLAAVFGDLAFSAIKRQTGIKDYGNLIPGHGGILDRFDCMTVVAPLAEVLLLLLPVAVK